MQKSIGSHKQSMSLLTNPPPPCRHSHMPWDGHDLARLIRVRLNARCSSRLQGHKGRSHLLSTASKLLGDMPAPIVLVSALCGLCRALGIETLACVSAENQSAYLPEYDAVFRKAYDGLMDALGVKRNERGYFVSSLPLLHKPMNEIKQGHKIRTRRKRNSRDQIAADCAGYIAQHLRNYRPPWGCRPPRRAGTGELRRRVISGVWCPKPWCFLLTDNN